MEKKYLIVGPKMTDNPQTHGGTPVLVEELLNYMKRSNKEYSFITTSFFGEGRGIANMLYTLIFFLFKLPSSDIIIVNVSRNGAYYFAPIALFFTKLLKKRFVFRRFGGNCLELYSKAKGIKKKLIEYVFNNADILFFEPKFIVEYFAKRGANVYWLPNTREDTPIKRDSNKAYSKKFIFLGEVREGKGIREILKASQMLDESYSIEIYGSLEYGNFSKASFDSYPNVAYKGVLDYSQVHKSLSANDVLLLPSYKEGYPGVIIEAFSVGLPVIASNIPSICEMVDESCAKLVEPKSAQSLAEAMKSFNNTNYQSYAKAAREKFYEYESNRVHKRMLEICEKEEL